MPAPLVARAPYDPDVAARTLARLGRLARAQPPAWDGATLRDPVLSLGHLPMGYMLPGRGLVLTRDLKSLQIRRPIPAVIEPTLFQQLRDRLRGRERLAAAIASAVVAAKCGWQDIAHLPMLFGTIAAYDDIINARANGKGDDVSIGKASITTVANSWFSMARLGGLPGALATTNIATGAVLDDTNAGAWSLALPSPGAVDKSYLLTIGFTSASAINILLVVDLLWNGANVNANIATLQTVTSAALTRYTGGEGVLATLEVTTAFGATASNFTVTYTDQAGNAAQSTGANAVTTSAIVGRLPVQINGAPWLPLASGDFGMRAIADARFSAAMGAGVGVLYLYKPLAWVPGVAANVYIERDSTTQIDGLTELVKDGSDNLGCVNAFVMPNTTSSGNFLAFLRTCRG